MIPKISKELDDMMIMYNWPAQPQIGYGVCLIYFAVLKENAKISSIEIEPNVYRIVFEDARTRPAGIHRTTLSPRPEK